MGRRSKAEEAKNKAFKALTAAIVEEVYEKLPSVMTVRELQMTVGTSASYLRASLVSGRITGMQRGSRWELPKEANEDFIKRGLLKRMKQRAVAPVAPAVPDARESAPIYSFPTTQSPSSSSTPQSGQFNSHMLCAGCGAAALEA
ncbi:hypothetical protein [Glaciibacter psychrotolerans]|uniref:Helix-turn-helix domain-containing protein n=1 Tax=Glaciibacter psychrotolerans TaxID=670054 RepID=A0A7Z0EH34_9MICO|nr:hypothetical protein [Leifsonia psychrotolerans]NYJ21551.1 hypothetical protein [Leifsonia psychrotolerans]